MEVTDRLEELCVHVPPLEAPAPTFFPAIEQGLITCYSNKNAYIDSLLDLIDVTAVQELNLNVLF